ncbi:transcription repressor NadR [Bacillus velezensis]|uniref:transcription repressor NadR n=1 Tax=Bacillus amyloliquefaciens group TaxID=1938374 RepID=UPI00039F73A3|nr:MULTISPECIES: transcription repressor NadR [Bacillus amyloliquefaciens group]MBA5711708.1 transcription repressor NadR [Bacillus velezensis]MBI0443334.1 transcription repressor NadR [Bacillus velezensis]MCC9264090.1 transcription repressor NadR [Bacillus velezensis]NIH00971.1 HTH domain-containing protein [Bacillus amyloliquefaciens]QQY04325.1 transcription repressor NadR [Bacillus velezensis]
MTEGTKLTGAKRRDMLLHWLKEAGSPLTGGELAKKANVSRQVIVQDISLLKAKSEPIIATSQGYLYISMNAGGEKNAERIIACLHGPERTEEELELIVDEGVTIKDVIIEHPVYGDLTAAIRVSTRKEVKQFMDHINSTNAAYLSQLTGGVHLHTLSAPTKERIDQACQALDDAGILIKD